MENALFNIDGLHSLEFEYHMYDKTVTIKASWFPND